MKRLYKFLYNKFVRYRENKIKQSLGSFGKDCNILPKISLGKPQNVHIGDYTLIQPNSTFIIYSGNFHLKKWSSLSCNCTIVTGNHVPTVGINQRTLERLHINDKETDVIVEEDCWIGANVTLISGAKIGRGSIIGACSLVNKEIPPYAVAVGTPAKIIASKFTYEEVLIHESKLYPKEERLSEEYLKFIFETYYKDKRSIGTNNISEEIKEKISSLPLIQYEI